MAQKSGKQIKKATKAGKRCKKAGKTPKKTPKITQMTWMDLHENIHFTDNQRAFEELHPGKTLTWQGVGIVDDIFNEFPLFTKREEVEIKKMVQTRIPIILKPSTIPGAGIGAFASQDLCEGCLLGYYSGDVISGEDYVELAQEKGEDIAKSHTLELIPKGQMVYFNKFIIMGQHWSIPMTLNGCLKGRENCKVVVGRIDGAVRAVMMTTKEVKKDTELVWFYSKKYKEDWSK